MTSIIPQRQCIKCLRFLPLEQFSAYANGRRSRTCSDCANTHLSKSAEGEFSIVPGRPMTGSVTCAKHGSKCCGRQECQR